MKPINIASCIKDISNLKVGAEKIYSIADYNESVDIRFIKQNSSKNVVVCFDCAKVINRYSMKKYPIFSNAITKKDLKENLIIIEDYIYKFLSHLKPNDEIFNNKFGLTGWHCLSQNVLKIFLQELYGIYKDRFILFGGSSGGFASLYYGSFIPASTSIAINPQIVIRKAITTLFDRFKNCNVIYNALNKILNNYSLDIRDIYKDKIENNIIYVMNNESIADMNNLNIYLLALMNKKIFDLEKVLVKMDFWGKVGHSASVPKQESLLWIKSALFSKENSAVSINKKYLGLKK